jgi:DNA-binding MarR family transcriptional regulator
MTGQRPLDFWLRLVDKLLNESYAAALEEHGLTRRQWVMINILSSGPTAAAELDTVLTTFLPPPERSSSSQEELAELLDSGWLSDQDGTYALTERGRLVHQRLEAAWSRRNDELLHGISAGEVAHLIALLERLAHNLGWAGDSAASTSDQPPRFTTVDGNKAG